MVPAIGKGIASIAPSLIGGITSIGSNLLGNKSRKKEASRAFNYSKRMFDYQNAYNTPTKQMQRLREAGLNPALMYGQGTTGNAQGYPQMQPQQMQNPLQLDALRSIAEIKNIEAQTSKTNAEVTLTNRKAVTELSNKLNIDSQRANTIQNTLNLKTQNEVNQFISDIKEIEANRAKNKGIIKGDLYGSLLDNIGFDPKNNEEHRTLLKKALTAYFGAKVAKEIVGVISEGVNMFKPKVPKNVTKNFYPQNN